MIISRFRLQASLFVLASTFLFQAWGGEVLGSAKTQKGGTVYLNLDAEPDSLHPITSTDAYSQEVLDYTISGLAVRRADNYEWEPELAEKIETSKDGMSFTFTIRQGATFHDGMPISADDVKFSFDSIFDPQFKAFHRKPYYENIEKAEIVSPNVVKFTAKKKYFGNLDVLAGLAIIPKHIYGKFDKKQNRTIVGSGPYKFVSYDRGKSLILERNKEWFGWKVPYFKNMFNFDKIFYRFIQDENLVLENLKRGDLDFEGLTAEQFTLKTNDKAFTDRLNKVKTENQAPGAYGFIGWNLKNPIFADRDTRVAMVHLFNRELMIKKFLFNMSEPATGPWYKKSPYASPRVKPFDFDQKKAAELLKKAGWKDSNQDGLLDKEINGKSTPFKFTLLNPNRDAEKYFTIFKEDLKKAGIEMEIKLVEWNSFLKVVEDRKYDAFTMAWGAGSVDLDPKQVWHSDSDREGGHNMISYHNKEVDQLIDQGREELNRKKRIAIFQKVYEKIADDAPYLFMFNRKFVTYALNKRVGQEKPTYNFELGRKFWWAEKP